jgi:hypothetical protein
MSQKPYHHRTSKLAARVRDLRACDVPVWKIAKRLQVDENTIRRHYADVLAEYEAKPGRPEFQPTDHQRNQVKMMAAIGTPHADIADFLDIAESTLDKHFADELRLGAIGANLQVAGNLYKMATGSAELKTTVTAAIWWSKARMNWKDTSRVENTGADGGPIQSEQQYVVVLPDNGRDGEINAAAIVDAIDHEDAESDDTFTDDEEKEPD